MDLEETRVVYSLGCIEDKGILPLVNVLHVHRFFVFWFIIIRELHAIKQLSIHICCTDNCIVQSSKMRDREDERFNGQCSKSRLLLRWMVVVVSGAKTKWVRNECDRPKNYRRASLPNAQMPASTAQTPPADPAARNPAITKCSDIKQKRVSVGKGSPIDRCQ